MARVSHLRQPPRVREVIAAALGIIEELSPPEDLRLPAFDHAIRLLGEVIVEPDNVPAMPMMAIPRGRPA